MKIIHTNLSAVSNGEDILLETQYGHTLPAKHLKNLLSPEQHGFEQRLAAINKNPNFKDVTAVVEGENLLQYQKNPSFVMDNDTLQTVSSLLGGEKVKNGFGRNVSVRDIVRGNSESMIKIESLFGDTIERDSYVVSVVPTWNAFSPMATAATHIARVLCLNGMLTDGKQYRQTLPLSNIKLIKDHLENASKFARTMWENHLKNKLPAMNVAMSSIFDVLTLHKLLVELMVSSFDAPTQDLVKLQMLVSTCDLANDELHKDRYADNAFSRSMATKTLPSFLSLYQLWNMATESLNYVGDENSNETKRETVSKINRFATSLFIEGQGAKQFSNPPKIIDREVSAFYAV